MMVHPWHLHGTQDGHVLFCPIFCASDMDQLTLAGGGAAALGQNFQIVGWGNGLFGAGKTTWNFDNPIRRDTVTIPGFSHVVIRILADNPGVWAFHCHYLWHAEGGMFVSVAQRMSELSSMLGTLDANGDIGAIKKKFCPVPAAQPAQAAEPAGVA
ncbi:Iron transport multicopper oxidase fio1 [Colletotrichum tanaceti]|nr:Iron transport multicopper oxidase fio1 [Colletotrichum tanaceti]